MVRGSRRAVLHAGLDGATEVVVLVPGFTGSKEDFLALLPLIAGDGRAAVAYDQLGQYESDGSDRAQDYALDDLGADVAEVVAQAVSRSATVGPDRPIAIHVVGHSFGGLVAQAAVADQRLVPATLTLLCSGPGALPESRWQQLPALVAALDEHDLATIWQIMRGLDGPAGSGPAVPDDVAVFLERRWHANHPVGLAQFATQLMSAPDRSADLARQSAAGLPITVICGAQDDAWPVPDQVTMAERIGAESIVLDGVGHSPNTEAPEVTAAALASGWARAGRHTR
jgi:pimeloyl-ACP methyl ester carboxylesterase